METNNILDFKISQGHNSYSVVGFCSVLRDGEVVSFEKTLSIPDLSSLPEALKTIREEYVSFSRQSSL